MKIRSFPLIAALLAGLCLLSASLPAAAQWKWRDAKGQVHVSDLPPPRDVPEKNVLSRPGALRKAPEPGATAATPAATPSTTPGTAASAPMAVASGTAAAPRGETELEKRRKKLEADETAKRKAEEDKVAGQKAENCKRAQAQIITLESGIRVATTNAKGEREFLDDGARQQELRRARAIAASDCR